MTKYYETHIKEGKGLVENKNHTFKCIRIENKYDLKIFTNELVPYYRELALKYGEEANEELAKNFPVNYAERKKTECIFTVRIFNQMIETNLPKFKLRMTEKEKLELFNIYDVLNAIHYKEREEYKKPVVYDFDNYVKDAELVLGTIQNIEVTNYFLNQEEALNQFMKEVKDAFALSADLVDKEIKIECHQNKGDGLINGHKVYTVMVDENGTKFAITIEPDYRCNYNKGTVVYYVVDARITEIEYV